MKLALPFAAIFVLAACAGPTKPTDPVSQCMIQHDVTGSYTYPEHEAVPFVTPIEDGT